MCPQSGDLREVARHVGASVYAARHRRALDHARKVPQDCGGDAYKSAVPRHNHSEPCAARTGGQESCYFFRTVPWVSDVSQLLIGIYQFYLSRLRIATGFGLDAPVRTQPVTEP